MIDVIKNKQLIKRVLMISFVVLIFYIYMKVETIKSIVNIVVTAFIFAYALKPLKDGISEKFNISKHLSSIIIIIAIVIIIILLINVIISSVLMGDFNFEIILNNVDDYMQSMFDAIGINNGTFVEGIYSQINENINLYLSRFSVNLLENSMNIFTNIISFAVVPVVTYYFLVDGDLICYKLLLILPTRKRVMAKKLLTNIDRILSRYIVSQLLLCAIIGVISYILFKLIGVEFALVLALLNGLFNIIPYFGPIIGGIPAVIIALLDSPTKAIWTILAILILQQIEGNILSPKITGDSTNMHPLVIIILLLIGEKVGGFFGMLIAIPIGVIVKVVYDDINNYLF